MGIYLNPGNGAFQKSLDSQIHVDKSMLISRTNRVVNTRDRYFCVSRPRRFGKTMAIDMLAAYYGRGCDSREQFSRLEIADDPSFDAHLNHYDVVKATMTSFLTRGGGTVEGAIALFESVFKDELAEEHPEVTFSKDLPLVMCFERVHAATGIPFVILIDEWDCVMRELQEDDASQRRYLDWLRDLMKDEEYIALAYATGILPVKKYGQHSALNMFTEISMLDAREFACLTGFVENEIMQLCKRFEMSFDEVKRWYDGYDVDGVEIYNPRSVVMSMTGHRFGNYWTRTETYEALRRYIMLDMDGLKQKVVRLIGGETVPVNVDTSSNDMTTFNSADDVLTLLVHLGYLTYERLEKRVRIPNSEVADEFVASIAGDDGWSAVADAITDSDALMQSTLAGDGDAVAAGVERAHRENASVLKYNDENSLACAISLAYYTARRTHFVEREVPAGKEFADLVFRPRPGIDAPALVVELKAGGSPQDAIAQIRQRDYADGLADYADVMLVGIAYDTRAKSEDYKTHRCAIEKL